MLEEGQILEHFSGPLGTVVGIAEDVFDAVISILFFNDRGEPVVVEYESWDDVRANWEEVDDG